jgi:hypothetical protein
LRFLRLTGISGSSAAKEKKWVIDRGSPPAACNVLQGASMTVIYEVWTGEIPRPSIKGRLGITIFIRKDRLECVTY